MHIKCAYIKCAYIEIFVMCLCYYFYVLRVSGTSQ